MSDFHALVQSLIHDVRTPDLMSFRKRAIDLTQKNSPRKRFERWRDSDQGKDWKRMEFERIGGQCQCCQHSFPSIHHLVIDHIHPIAKFPELATETQNFQLLCPPCNQTKGARTEQP